MKRAGRLKVYRWIGGALALVMSLILLDRLRSWKSPAQRTAAPEVQPGEIPDEAAGPGAADEHIALLSWRSLLLPGRLLFSLGCFVIAQDLLVGSRSPVAPLLLYGLGFIVVLPALDWTADRAVRLTISRRAAEAAVVIGLMVLTAIIQAQTPSPAVSLPEHSARILDASAFPEGGPLFRLLVNVFAGTTPDLASLQRLSGLLVVLMILAVYCLGRFLVDPLLGIFAAGFAAVCLWTLALGKAGTVYSGLALCSALYLAALYYVRGVRTIMCAGLALLVGWLMSPLFLSMILLLPIRLFLGASQRMQRVIAAILALLAAGLMIASLPPIPRDYQAQVGFSVGTAASDAFVSALLLFNLTSDPNPLHGVVDRPVFAPALAGVFALGLLAWAWRANSRRSGLDRLLLAALIVSVVPAAVAIAPPLSYPNLELAAMALPVGAVIAAYGLHVISQQITGLWGRWGTMLVAALWLYLLIMAAADARYHYTRVFLPTYARAVPAYLEPGGER